MTKTIKSIVQNDSGGTNPDTHAHEDKIWELTFEDNSQTVVISTPPSLSMNSLTSDSTDIKEGQAVTFTISISNDGGATASGVVNLLQSGTSVATKEFTVAGFSTNDSIYLYYSVLIDLHYTLY